ncbi:hypothetical protein AB751O23_AA_00450 [Chlamydiales bacterium SCGC AB-751-O23]|nr:hypothetical protein AB751O23_AA_00450 [Chlamydiales bacterium SCGC AB-751-O23]
MKKNKKLLQKLALLASGSLLLCAPTALSATEQAGEFSSLGSGAEIRSELNVSGVLLAGGEGSCGEGRCGGDKAVEADKEDKSAEGSCGEGKCGGKKDKHAEGGCGGKKDKKAEGSCGGKKDKHAEGSCGEGRCGGSK